ncbi:MAG: hypothetical protein PQJ58_10685 [Spirochaetales bacterium]|nr:hypothetical protein [Spirochaetales bacterium]
MKQEILLDPSGEGEVRYEVGMASYLGEVITQMSMLLDPDTEIPGEEDSLFDLPAIEQGFSSNENLSAIELSSTDRHNMKGSFRFSSVEDMLAQVDQTTPQSKMIRFSRDSDVSKLDVKITRDTVIALLESNPALNNPLVQNFGPAATLGLSAADYLDMMEFALGEESRMGIQNSSLSITVKVAGTILKQEGGETLDASTVRFEIPLLDILILDKTLGYSLSYR